jgi:hypothetical protein
VALQRQAGNRAVVRLLQRDSRAGIDDLGSVQRDVRSHPENPQGFSRSAGRLAPGRVEMRGRSQGASTNWRRSCSGSAVKAGAVVLWHDPEARVLVRAASNGNEIVSTVHIGTQWLVNPRRTTSPRSLTGSRPRLCTPRTRSAPPTRCAVNVVVSRAEQDL